jgi:cytochrome c biogenesis protein CcdA/glutaredoxin
VDCIRKDLVSSRMWTKNILKVGCLLFAFILISIPCLYSQELIFFYEPTCPKCASINDFLEKRIRINYPIKIKKLDIHQSSNAELMIELAEVYQAEDILKGGTPAVFVNDLAVHGANRSAMRKIEQAVRKAVRENKGSPLSRLGQSDPSLKLSKRVTLPVVIGSAAVDSINPCACAVLVLLLGTILLATKRDMRRVIISGFAFTTACFISYFLMGLGLFTAVRLIGIQHYLYIFVAALAFLLGIWNIREGIGRIKKIHTGLPSFLQNQVKKSVSGITSVSGSFIIGFLVSIFLLPCTSGPYVVIIGMLSRTSTRFQALIYLLIYNFIFIIPFIIIILAVGLGLTTTARVEKWRGKNLSKFQVATGLVMILIGLILTALLIWDKI